MKASACPVCEAIVPAESLSELEPFNCPHCDEPLRAVRRPGSTGWWAVNVFVIVLVMTYRLGFIVQLALAVGMGVLIALLNFILNRLLGYELEPVGRIPLGGLND